MYGSAQTLESIRSDFDRIAALSDETGNHYPHYYKYLLGYVPMRCGQVLEIGCATGQFSRLLAARAEKVVAIDLSPEMIRVAGKRSRACSNIEFVNCDVMSHRLAENQFDCIVTLPTLHHLPIENALRRIKKALKPGGIFVCLDLYQRANITDLCFDAVAYPVGVLLTLIKGGRLRAPREIREAYAEHGKTDTYPKLTEVRQLCNRILPGARVKRHLFWRYAIVWKRGLGLLGVR